MVHHSAVSHEKNADQFKANNAYHKAKWNFKSSLGFFLGYNYEISKGGKVTKAREEGEGTAAAYQSWVYRGVVPRYVGPLNDGRCVHICIDGNFDIEKPSPTQIFALRDLLKEIVKRQGIPSGNIYFHRNVANKTCPGAYMELNYIRSLPNR